MRRLFAGVFALPFAIVAAVAAFFITLFCGFWIAITGDNPMDEYEIFL